MHVFWSRVPDGKHCNSGKLPWKQSGMIFQTPCCIAVQHRASHCAWCPVMQVQYHCNLYISTYVICTHTHIFIRIIYAYKHTCTSHHDSRYFHQSSCRLCGVADAAAFAWPCLPCSWWALGMDFASQAGRILVRRELNANKQRWVLVSYSSTAYETALSVQRVQLVNLRGFEGH